MENWILTKEAGNFEQVRKELTKLGEELFKKITSYPQEIRGNSKKSTGIQIVCWVEETRNIIIIPIQQPSDAAKFFSVEKAVRAAANYDFTSQESEDTELFRFRGSISYEYTSIGCLAVSCSGLTGDEDCLISTIFLGKILGKSPKSIIGDLLKRERKLPEQFSEEDNYLYDLIEEYSK